jgi:hypothetical protein
MAKLRKIISGGQTGVDQAALQAARDCGLEIGGWCPPGRACEAGVIPEEFPLRETQQERSPDAPGVPRSQRTEWNVRDADGILVILGGTEEEASHRPWPGFGMAGSDAATEDAGTRWALECAARYKRPFLVCDLDDPEADDKIRGWLMASPIRTLSVGGPAESNAPGIGERAYALLRPVFENLGASVSDAAQKSAIPSETLRSRSQPPPQPGEVSEVVAENQGADGH